MASSQGKVGFTTSRSEKSKGILKNGQESREKSGNLPNFGPKLFDCGSYIIDFQ